MEYARVRADDRVLAIRDIVDADIETFVSYWHDGGADLEFLGIDSAKLGNRDDTRTRFRSFINRHNGPQDVVGFTFTQDDQPIGYTNINILGRREGYLHVHLTDPEAREHGVVTTLLINSLPVIDGVIFPQFDLDALILETRTRNVGINRVVQKAGLEPVATKHLDQPDGVAGPGEFNIYVLDRDLIGALVGTRSEPSCPS